MPVRQIIIESPVSSIYVGSCTSIHCCKKLLEWKHVHTFTKERGLHVTQLLLLTVLLWLTRRRFRGCLWELSGCARPAGKPFGFCLGAATCWTGAADHTCADASSAVATAASCSCHTQPDPACNRASHGRYHHHRGMPFRSPISV